MHESNPILSSSRRAFFLALVVLFLTLGVFALMVAGPGRVGMLSEADSFAASGNTKEMVHNRVREAIQITTFAHENLRNRMKAELERKVGHVANRLALNGASNDGDLALLSVAEWIERKRSASDFFSEEMAEYMFLSAPDGRVLRLQDIFTQGSPESNPAQRFRSPGESKGARHLRQKMARIADGSADSSDPTSLKRIGDSGWKVGGFIPSQTLKQTIRERLLRILQQEKSSPFPSLFLIDSRDTIYSFRESEREKGSDAGGYGAMDVALRIRKTIQAVRESDGGFIQSLGGQEEKGNQREYDALYLQVYEPWEWVFLATDTTVSTDRSANRWSISGVWGSNHSLWLNFFVGLLLSGLLLYLLYRFLFVRVIWGLDALKGDFEAAAEDPRHPFREDRFSFSELSSLAASANRMLEKWRRREERTEWERNYFERLFENAPDGIVLLDANGIVFRVNKEFCTHFLYKEDEVLGRDLDVLVGGQDKLNEAKEFTDKVSRGYRIYSETVRYRKDGEAVHVAVYGVPLTTPEGEHLIYGVYKDIREKKEAEEKLLQLTETDTLTGVANRLKFDQLLEEEIRLGQRYPNVFSLIMMDIDFFKQINDQYGHLVGDSVLKELAASMRELIRDTDVLARIGGEEFIILLRRTDYDMAVRFAERLRRQVETSSFSVDQTITCSFGVTAFQEGDDPKKLLTRVDDYLYSAKKHGRNRVVGGVRQDVMLGY